MFFIKINYFTIKRPIFVFWKNADKIIALPDLVNFWLTFLFSYYLVCFEQKNIVIKCYFKKLNL